MHFRHLRYLYGFILILHDLYFLRICLLQVRLYILTERWMRKLNISQQFSLNVLISIFMTWYITRLTNNELCPELSSSVIGALLPLLTSFFFSASPVSSSYFSLLNCNLILPLGIYFLPYITSVLAIVFCFFYFVIDSMPYSFIIS